jgi:hypothetical protein
MALRPNEAETAAYRAVLGLFASHDAVGIAERHRDVELQRFLRGLIAYPGFSRSVRDVVVECGTARYQAVIDAYVAGKPVPVSSLRRVWRDTTMFLSWDAPVYAEFFAAVRRANLSLPASRKIRVHLGDPPIVWEKVRTGADYERFAKRDTFYFKLVDRLLAERRKVLLIFGGMHLLKRDIRGPGAPPSKREPLPDLTTRYGARLATVWTVTGKDGVILPAAYPDFQYVQGTALGEISSKAILPPGLMFFRTVNGKAETYLPDPAMMPKLGQVVDGVLAFAPRTSVQSVVLDPVRDREYIAELRRRAPILKAVFGMDFLPDLESALRARK